MELDVYHTHMELYPYQKDDYPIIENMYMAEDAHTHTMVPCGYLIEDGKLFLPRGTPVSKIEHICAIEAHYIQDPDPIEPMRREHHSYYDVRNQLQEDSIAFLQQEDHQLALNLAPGTGKTFCAASAITNLKQRVLIVVPDNALKLQWIKTFRTMFTYREIDIVNISGGAAIRAIMEDAIDPADVYVVSHSTLRNYCTDHGGYSLHKFFEKLRIGIKVYDESHLDFSNILLIDAFSNTNRTWYLTATFDRSSKSESRCFKRAFNGICTFGEYESKEQAPKHVIYHVVNINSHIAPNQLAKVISYTGMTAASYGKYAFHADLNQTAYETIVQILKKIEHVEGKTLIFIPLISAVDLVTKQLKETFPEKTIGAFHSKMSMDDKEASLQKDIIVTTIKSCGTGKDIPGLRCCINCEPLASKVQAEQLIGRLRPYAQDKDTYFFDVCDVSIPHINWWWRARFKKIQGLVKSTVYLSME